MSESEIPTDIREKATMVAATFAEAIGPTNYEIEQIARAILAERARCARIAEDEDGYFLDWGEDRNRAVAQKTCDAIAAAIRRPTGE